MLESTTKMYHKQQLIYDLTFICQSINFEAGF